MMVSKDKNKEYTLLTLLAVAVLFLAAQQGFFGSMYIVCDNFEPRSFSEFTTTINGMGGSINMIDPFIIPVTSSSGTELETYNMYKTESNMGRVNVIPMENMACSDFLERVYENPFYEENLDMSRRSEITCIEGYTVINGMCQFNTCWSAEENLEVYGSLASCNEAAGYTTTNFMNLERRQILNTGGGYMFCNYEGNLALVTDSVETLSAYVERFEVCSHTETRKDKSETEENDFVEVPVPEQETSPPIESGEEQEGFNTTYLLILIAVFLVSVYVYMKKREGEGK